MKFYKYEVKKQSDGRLRLERLLRVYYKIQKAKMLSDEEKSQLLNKIYQIFGKFTKKEIKCAARKELNKDYSDNVYSVFCQYILLTGEV